MIRRPPRSTRTDTLFPYTTLFRSLRLDGHRLVLHALVALAVPGNDSHQVEGLGQDRIVIGIGRFHAPVKAVRPVADIIRRRKQLIVSLHGEAAVATIGGRRSEERRVGKACVSTCRSRWSPYH